MVTFGFALTTQRTAAPSEFLVLLVILRLFLRVYKVKMEIILTMTMRMISKAFCTFSARLAQPCDLPNS